MLFQTDDVRIKEIKELLPPIAALEKYPVTEVATTTTFQARQSIHRILTGEDDRLLVVIGPCSIHDSDLALDYGRRLLAMHEELARDLVVVMRVYFEKPRTTVGWKGLINDPHLDGSFDINNGLRKARKLLLDLNDMGLPAATEFLDMITPQYIADLISWGAIGARTTESQVHRELASGLSCPVGFKNGTDGNLKIAIDAIRAASVPHHFLSVTKFGHSAIVSTGGNPDCHVIPAAARRLTTVPSMSAVRCMISRKPVWRKKSWLISVMPTAARTSASRWKSPMTWPARSAPVIRRSSA